MGLRVSDHHAVTNPEETRRRGEHVGISVHHTEIHRISLDHPDPAALIEQSTALGARALLAVSDLIDHGERGCCWLSGAGHSELRAIIESETLGSVQLCDAPLTPPPTDQLVNEARDARMCPSDGEPPFGELIACLPDGVTISVEVQSDALIDIAPCERAQLLHDRARALLAA